MTGASARPAAAVFGKLPAHGDFVSRGLGEGARTAWDAFVSEGLERAAEALGDGFADAHDTAPPWRFVLAPELELANGWSVGALAPSVDRVGRRFVIVVLAQGLDADRLHQDDEVMAEKLEAAIFSAFEQGLNADALLTLAVQAIHPPSPHPELVEARGDAPSAAAAGPPSSFDRLRMRAADALQENKPASRWWTLGGYQHAPQSLTADRADPALFTAMLTPSAPEAMAEAAA